MRVLVTGGAGYIGSFMTKRLLDYGHEVVVFDSLERGYRNAVDTRAKFIQGDIKNPDSLEILFGSQAIDAVMHFAGYISVEESTKNPQMYHLNNTIGTENLLKAMIEFGQVDKFIFSSTAAVYGNPIKTPIPEDHPKNPTSPYGKSKLEVEEMLQIFGEEQRLNFVSLRYFNAAGAAVDASMGEAHEPETHIIPLGILAALKGTEFSLYGTDYNTPDGTCVRDYIHVIDLVEAHILALNYLDREKGGFFYNVGVGRGYSNKEVIDMIKKVSGKDLKVKVENRRAGDPQVLIADATRIQRELGFNPNVSDLETIVKTAFLWHQKSSKYEIVL
ncbi:MAG: UDP-glucose 4-epimerase GalE [Candidatus Levybacteria bacterium RIFCSPHIGHO2_01_FULL_38_26]|nr:MAG: UDP-glucose 4-epimerase GalE [Candidatus Levybacteria bacterium RIFCSPHIGHO2_01_FULL_38_26]